MKKAGETYIYIKNLQDTGWEVKPEHVVCAANRFKDGVVVLGVRHGCEIMMLTAKAMGYDNLLHTEQGFYTNWQRFVTRQEAMKIVKDQDQWLYKDGTHNDDVLYSECLY